jgi:hypothetical protein
MTRFALIPLTLLIALPAVAQDDDPPSAEAPPPPTIREPLPPKVQDPDEQIQPQVVIRREDDRIVEEYSSGGEVYMIRVTPLEGGPSYYLIDNDGDGTLESREDGAEPVQPAYWKIAEW